MTVTSHSRTIAWTIWMVVSLFYAYQYVLRVMPNIMINDIMQQFGISAATFGQFSGIYYIGYSLVHLPVGLLLDRYGPRKVIPICMLLTVVGLLPLLFAHHWIYPILGRLLIGIGSSAAILGVFKIVRLSFSAKQFPRMLSFSVTIGLLGAIYGGGPVSYMHRHLGYEQVLQLFVYGGIILAFVTYWIIPKTTSTSEGSVRSHIKEVFKNTKVMGACFCAGLMVGPVEGFADVWGNVFLQQAYGFDKTLAATLPSMIFMGMCFGAPLLSLIADKVGGYLLTIIGAGALMAIGFSLMLMWQLPSTFLTLSFVIMGVCCAYQVLAIYKVSTYVREQVAGLTTAVANMIIMIFGYAFHTLIGGMITQMGGCTPHALIWSIAVIPVALGLGTLGFGWLYMMEKKGTKEVAQL